MPLPSAPIPALRRLGKALAPPLAFAFVSLSQKRGGVQPAALGHEQSRDDVVEERRPLAAITKEVELSSASPYLLLFPLHWFCMGGISRRFIVDG